MRVDVHARSGFMSCRTTVSRSTMTSFWRIAEGVVLQEVDADGEPVLEVLDLEDLVDGLVENRREGGKLGDSKLSVVARLRPCR